jgi:hypothetical protein
MSSTPPQLFKYEPNSEQAIENLQNGVLFFGPPSKFNDPFDCALWPQIKRPTDIEANTIGARFLDLGTGPFQAEMQRQFLAVETSEWRDRLMSTAEKMLAERRDEFYESTGISCFSECNDNILMWSHYSSHHRGFCLEFHSDTDLFTKAKKVLYSSDIPTIDLCELMLDDDFEKVLELFCTKSSDWQYEREWRVLRQAVGKYCYPQQLLKAIYFGAKAPESMIKEICRVVTEKQMQVDLHQGRLSKSRFRIEFDPFKPDVTQVG